MDACSGLARLARGAVSESPTPVKRSRTSTASSGDSHAPLRSSTPPTSRCRVTARFPDCFLQAVRSINQTQLDAIGAPTRRILSAAIVDTRIPVEGRRSLTGRQRPATHTATQMQESGVMGVDDDAPTIQLVSPGSRKPVGLACSACGVGARPDRSARIPDTAREIGPPVGQSTRL